MDVLADFYMCTDDDALATAEGCPKSAWYYLKTERFSNQSIQWNHHFSGEDVLRIGWSNLFGETLGGILYEIILGDFVDCLHGSKSSCAWTSAMFVPVGKALGAIADSVRALDAAAKTGIGFTDAWKGLRALNVPADVLAGAAYRSVDKLVASCTAGAATGFKTMAAGAAGDACKGIVAYNTTVLGKKAYEARKRLNVGWKRNVAVAHLPGWGDNVTGDYVVGAGGDSMHAEQSIIKQIKAKGYDPKDITELYTGRKPCPKLCRPLLADELKEGTPVNWAVPYGEYPAINKQAARKLRKLIEQADQGN